MNFVWYGLYFGVQMQTKNAIRADSLETEMFVPRLGYDKKKSLSQLLKGQVASFYINAFCMRIHEHQLRAAGQNTTTDVSYFSWMHRAEIV